MDSFSSRILSLSGPMLLMVSCLGLLVFGGTTAQSQFQSDVIVLSSIGLLAMGGAISAFSYLRGSQIARKPNDTVVNVSNSFDTEELLDRLEGIDKQLLGLTAQKQEPASFEVSDEERSSIIASMKDSLSSDVSRQIFEGAKLETEDILIDHKKAEVLRREYNASKIRLSEETAALSRRGNLNLIIGGFTTLLAVGILSYVVLTAESETLKGNDYLWHYIPRITISIFIQVFSFFFLKLYRNSLEDIKYFQNELTNIELKQLALESALLSKNKDSIAEVIKNLSLTDRNSKLQKGESTVDLERLRAENQSLSDMLGSAKDIIGSFKNEKA